MKVMMKMKMMMIQMIMDHSKVASLRCLVSDQSYYFVTHCFLFTLKVRKMQGLLQTDK